MSDRYDAVVIGAGPAGEVAASRLPKLGLRTALIERELVGGGSAPTGPAFPRRRSCARPRPAPRRATPLV